MFYTTIVQLLSKKTRFGHFKKTGSNRFEIGSMVINFDIDGKF